MRKVNLAGFEYGVRFSFLTFIRLMPKTKGEQMCELACDCGKNIIIKFCRLKEGAYKSCGCKKYEIIHAAVRKHGLSTSKIYNVYASMRSRCLSKTNHAYTSYGGRGIGIADRWLEKKGKGFLNFIADMGERPDGYQLERIDNDSGYSPDNCIWADRTTQQRNRRVTVRYQFGGKNLTAQEWSLISGVPSSIIYWRISKGWDIEKAIFQKKRFKSIAKNSEE